MLVGAVVPGAAPDGPPAEGLTPGRCERPGQAKTIAGPRGRRNNVSDAPPKLTRGGSASHHLLVASH